MDRNKAENLKGDWKLFEERMAFWFFVYT